MRNARRRMIYGVLLLTNAFNVAYLAWYTIAPRILAPAVHYSYRGHNFPRLLPLPSPLNSVTLTDEETVHYAPLGRASERQWASLFEPDGGYVRLGPANRTFALTMFHELHCLWALNRGFVRGARSIPIAHIDHCLNYLRQAVLCHPDLTLEPGDFEERDFERDMVGGTHECRDWGAVYEFVDKNFQEWTSTLGID